ncbi:DNA protecting protein DprA [Methylovorus sp. MM2]|uniref:DNA-processing protein DprA n=1 Tax=Methylovorus sp. MM2 TaxID=1848038 RepID=UPI0007DEB46F|nr:DNA-processing protein DprA [Methylovorus sp. MM2]OAM51805.1 DNA protecting protein DprA [Methylovorus sp. MM2]
MSSTTDAQRTESALWISLGLIHGLGGQGICQLLKAFGSPEHIYAAPVNEVRKIVSDAVAQAIAKGPDIDSANPTLEWLEQEHNHLITLADAEYPQLLLEIPDPPPLIYAKGQLERLKQPCLAIVGSRNSTTQGEKNAEDFAHALSQHGLCIVSGMALGIDGAAHRGALKANGSTIAVVGTGLDIVYPAKHRDLAHQIVERGLIISEFPLGTPSRAQNFPRRNRLISGLSLGCLVVEANTKSGSLITARLATEQGREVFAIPGSIHSPVAKGCHELIKQGAKLVDDISDIISELGDQLSPLSRQHSMVTKALETTADPLLECMGFDPISMESLVEESGLTSDNLSAMLLVLELENKVASLPGGRYQRIA